MTNINDGPNNRVEAAAEFWAYFKQEKQAIEQGLESLGATSKDAVAQRLNALEKQVNTAATLYLPPYDLRQCLEQLKELSDKQTKLRNSVKKSFAFSSKLAGKKTAASSASQTPPLSASSTTTYANLVPPEKSAAFQDGCNLIISATSPADVGNQPKDVYLLGLRNCFVDCTQLAVTSVHIQDLTNCIVFIGCYQGSILLNQCRDCIVVVGCHQFRMHESVRCHVYLYSSSRPIIEDCMAMYFAPYPFDFAKSLRDRTSTVVPESIDPEKNLYSSIEDFKWLRQQASPNWRLLTSDEQMPLTEWSSVFAWANNELGSSGNTKIEQEIKEIISRNCVLLS